MAATLMTVALAMTWVILRLPSMAQAGYLAARESESSCGNTKTVYITIDGHGFFPPILRRSEATVDHPLMRGTGTGTGTAFASLMATTTALVTVTETITSQVTVVASVTQVVTVTDTFTCSPIIKAKAIVTETAETIETIETLPDNVFYYVAVSDSTQYLDKTPPPGIPLQSSTTTINVQPVPTGAMSVSTEGSAAQEEVPKTTTGFTTVTSTSTRLHTVIVANGSVSVSSAEATRTPTVMVHLGSEGWNQTSISTIAGPTATILPLNSSVAVANNNDNTTTTTVFIATVPGSTTTITQRLLFANQTRTALLANPTLSFITTLDAETSTANTNASRTSWDVKVSTANSNTSSTSRDVEAPTANDYASSTSLAVETSTANNHASTTTNTRAGVVVINGTSASANYGVGVNSTHGLLSKRTVLRPIMRMAIP